MFTIPGARPQSGTTVTPFAIAFSCICFCNCTISVFPPRSQKCAPTAIAASVIGRLK